MSDEKQPTASDIKGLKLNSFSVCRPWNSKGWVATANLSANGDSYNGLKEVKVELHESIACEIVRLLAPVIAKQASESAQQLANESKQLADNLAASMLSIEDKKQ